MKQNKLLDVMPECYVDTGLIEYLLSAGVNHQHCCAKVVGQLKTTFADRFAIGIIDKDKVQLGYIRECEAIVKTEHLTLMRHRSNHQYLITIAPAVDKFIIDCANKQGVNLAIFRLPSELKSFTKVSKSVASSSDTRFRALFAAIKDNPEIRALKAALEYLCDNKYTSDSKRLQEIFEGR